MMVNLRPLVNIDGRDKPLMHYNVKISTKTNILDQKRGVIELKPGFHLTIRVTPKVIDTSENFVVFDVDKRNCKLPYETNELKFLQSYTKDGCELECALNKSLSICKCLPWYLPNNFNEVSMCDMFGARCVETIISNETNYKKCKHQCLEDCSGTSYTAIPSYVKIDLEQTCAQQVVKDLFEKLYEHHRYEIEIEQITMGKWKNLYYDQLQLEFCKDYILKYISIVTVETPVDSVVKTKRVARITFNDQLAVVGGTLGLFTGISILSMVEIFCFCLTMTKRVFQMGRNCCFKKNMVTDEEKNDEDKISEDKMDENKMDEHKMGKDKINENNINEEKMDEEKLYEVMIDKEKIDKEKIDTERIPERRNLIYVEEFKKATNQATIKKAENNVQRHGHRSVEKLDEEKPRWRI